MIMNDKEGIIIRDTIVQFYKHECQWEVITRDSTGKYYNHGCQEGGYY